VGPAGDGRNDGASHPTGLAQLPEKRGRPKLKTRIGCGHVGRFLEGLFLAMGGGAREGDVCWKCVRGERARGMGGVWGPDGEDEAVGFLAGWM